MRRKHYLDEHDRDVFEAELAYDRWLNGRLQPPLPPLTDDRDDGYDPADPDDRLEQEGGRL